MDRRHLLPTLFALCALPVSAQAQDFGLPTPEEYAERAAEAEAAPLFQSLEALKITLTTDIDWLRDERNDSVEVEGTATFIDLDGTEVTKPVDVRTRGIFRMNKRNCNFPPLRLDFPRGQMEGTVFHGQNRLKLVTPCHDGRDSYQNYVFDEYLAYRTLQVITPYSFRVRLVEITYVDIEDDYDTRTKYGFLIEDEDAMAERNRSTMVDVSQIAPGPWTVLRSKPTSITAQAIWEEGRQHFPSHSSRKVKGDRRPLARAHDRQKGRRWATRLECSPYKPR